MNPQTIIEKLADKDDYKAMQRFLRLKKAIWQHFNYSGAKTNISGMVMAESVLSSIWNNMEHPIHLHDVLEKMQGKYAPNDKVRNEQITLTALWGRCGFTRSLQTLQSFDTVESKALFEFLDDIFKDL